MKGLTLVGAAGVGRIWSRINLGHILEFGVIFGQTRKGTDH